MKTIGIIGTGIQGTAIIKKLIVAGYAVSMYDQISSQMSKAMTFGALASASAAELIQKCEIILLVLPAGNSPLDLLSRQDCREALKPGKVILQLGTTSVEAALRMNDLVTAKNAVFAECILCGPIATIMDGSCPILYGGDEDVEKLIDAMCDNFGKILQIGAVGQASAFNLAALSHVYSIVHGFGLGSAMIERSNIDQKKWLNFIKTGIGGHPADFLVDFLWPAHFENRSYGLIGPAQVKNDGAEQESKLIAARAKELKLDTGQLNAIYALHKEAHAKASEADWSSFYDHLVPINPSFDEPSFMPEGLQEGRAPEQAKQTSIFLAKQGVLNTLNANPIENHKVKVSEAMQKGGPVAYPDMTYKEASALLSSTMYSDIPVVNPNTNEFIGILSEGDLLRAILPDFAEVIAINPSLSEASRIFEDNAKRLSNQSISNIIISDSITLSLDQDILSATIMMVEKMIRRLPVTDNGKYVGSLSRADIGHCMINH